MPLSNEAIVESLSGPEKVAMGELIEAVEAWMARRGTPNE